MESCHSQLLNIEAANTHTHTYISECIYCVGVPSAVSIQQYNKFCSILSYALTVSRESTVRNVSSKNSLWFVCNASKMEKNPLLCMNNNTRKTVTELDSEKERSNKHVNVFAMLTMALKHFEHVQIWLTRLWTHKKHTSLDEISLVVPQ